MYIPGGKSDVFGVDFSVAIFLSSNQTEVFS